MKKITILRHLPFELPAGEEKPRCAHNVVENRLREIGIQDVDIIFHARSDACFANAEGMAAYILSLVSEAPDLVPVFNLFPEGSANLERLLKTRRKIGERPLRRFWDDKKCKRALRDICIGSMSVIAHEMNARNADSAIVLTHSVITPALALMWAPSDLRKEVLASVPQFGEGFMLEFANLHKRAKTLRALEQSERTPAGKRK
jgi:hypothetical protein